MKTKGLEERAFLTVEDVAQLMNVSKPTVQSWLADHSLRAFRKDRTVRVSRKALETFISEHPW
ncbi:MAG: helix-turn-helix domain-containing protein [Actinomyces sp.]|uniref:helix-turn-helix domain-containing protein n=1 Tax=uncultured Actinomyces sp. TaxID=249061 RepID=UPI0028047EF7|nr:helix-turn-helix domain-containing protein [uncultured Actinomyces sp.]MDU4831135.1 helix-turn-helix domain-containing protein [Actinomyces sp.]